MTINKNKLKLIPIFNKSLKEIYTNKEYDMIHLYSLLKENIEDNLHIEVSEKGNNIEQLTDANYFYLKHEKDPNYIHIFQGSLNANKEIINPKYIYSYNQKLFKDLDDNIKKLTNIESISKINSRSEDDTIKKLLLESIVILINENFNNGLLNDKTTFLSIIRELILKNFDEQFNIFKKIIINKNNIVTFENLDDEINYKDINIDFKELNSGFTETANVKYYIKKKGHTRLNIYLDEDNIKIFFKECIEKFSQINQNEDITIVEKDQNLILIKIKKIVSYYTDSFDEVLFKILKVNEQRLEKDFRKTPSNINEAITILNDTNNAFSFAKKLLGKGAGQGNVKGKGELSVHLMLNTTNACTAIEPDAIIKTTNGEIKCSVKQFSSDSATIQTGQPMQANIQGAYTAFLKSLHINKLDFGELFNALFNILKQNEQTKTIDSDRFKQIFNITFNIKEFKENLFIKNDIINNYKNLKKEIASEHGAQYIIYLTTEDYNYNFDYIDCSDINNVADNLQISSISSSDRFQFRIRKLKCVTDDLDAIDIEKHFVYNYNAFNVYGGIETILGYILLALDNNQKFINKVNEPLSKKPNSRRRNIEQNESNINSGMEQQENSGYKRKGITLKEVFKNLY